MSWPTDAEQTAHDDAAKLRYLARWMPGALSPIRAVIDAFVAKAHDQERAEHQTRLTNRTHD